MELAVVQPEGELEALPLHAITNFPA